MNTLKLSILKLQESKTHAELVEATIVAINSFDEKIDSAMASILDIVKKNGEVSELVLKQLEDVLETLKDHDKWEKEQKFPQK